MRKILILILCLALLSATALTSFAAGDTLTMSDAKGQPGEVVFLTLTMNESVVADTMGVKYTYDKDILKAAPASSSWSKQGALQDFGTKDVGVWAASAPMDLKGSVCILAFSIKDGVAFQETQVTCELTVRNGSELVGTYTANAKVSNQCTHSYSQWKDMGNVGHNRACTSCGAQQTQSHQWDEGKITEKPNNPSVSIQTFTCQVCGATKETEILTPVKPTEAPAESKPTTPPKETTKPIIPTKPTTKPTQKPQATQPVTVTLPTGPTIPLPTVTETTVPVESTQTNYLVESVLQAVEEAQTEEHFHPEEETEAIADHDHDHESEGSTISYGTVFAVLAAIGVIAWLALWLIKRKR